MTIIIRTWTPALDILDFIDLLSQSKLYSDTRFVYITLTIWSISCLQFIIQISTIKKILIKSNYPRVASVMTYSLLSMIMTDIPYLIIRLYVILGMKNHDYTSYFLVLKNIVIIILQTSELWINFNKPTRNNREIVSI